VKTELELERNLSTLCSIILGQCTKGLITQLKTDTYFNTKIESGDFVWLLGKISEVLSGITSTTYVWDSYTDALVNLTSTRQRDNEDTEHYVKRMEGAKDRLCLAGGEHVLSSPKLLKSKDKSDPKKLKQQQDEFMSFLLIRGANKKRSDNIAKELKNRMHPWYR